MTRVDAHHHLWRYTEEEYGWIGPEMAQLRRDFLSDELAEEMRSAAVNGSVVVQARQTLAETDWLLSLAESAPQIWGVVGWLPLASAEFEGMLQRYAGNPWLKGVRHVVQAEPAGFLHDPAFNRGMRAVRSSGLVYDILIYAHQLAEATEFVDRHPAQPFVLDHIAKPAIRSGELEQWATHVREIAKRDNVTCKISGMVTEADPLRWTEKELRPYFDVVLEAFGPERLMVGTDWPVLTVGCSYAQWWKTVEGWIAQLSADEQRAVLGMTAMRVYNLAGANTATPNQQEVSEAA